MPKIVLSAINAKWIHPSLALRLLKANLGSLSAECEILEFALRQPLNEKVDPILAARPELLGLSVSVWNHQATLELLEALDTAWRQAKRPVVVLGGPEVSWLPEESELFGHADYVIRGEGEAAFRLLCCRLFSGDAQNANNAAPEPGFIISKDPAGGKTAAFVNSGGTAVDVSAISSAYHLYTEEDLQKKLTYVEASRGCPYTCEFCQGSVMRTVPPAEQNSGGCRGKARRVREFPVEPFLASMDSLIKRGARNFKFLDRTFNFDTDRAKRIMEFFLERIAGAAPAAESRPLCVHFEMVPFRFPAELKEVIRRFPPGTLRLELGIQTLNAQTAALIRRAGAASASTPEEELENLKFLCRETNAILHVDLIAGLPGEDLVSFGSGFDRLWQLMSEGQTLKTKMAFEIQPGILKCLPGTAIVRHCGEYGITYAPAAPYEVTETGALPARELGRIKNFARFWEIIVNRNPFPLLLPRLLPRGEPCFKMFMELSDRMLEKFGRNWGIDRSALGSFLENCPMP